MLDKEKFEDELAYKRIMNIAENMLDERIITKAEYKKLREVFLTKYTPITSV